MEQFGTEQIIKVLDVIIEAGNVAPKVQQASNVVGKISALLPMTDELVALISLQPTVLKKEWADLSVEEKSEIMTHAKDKYDIEDDGLEAKVEEGLMLVNEAVNFVAKAIDYAKSFKKGE